MKGKKLLVSLLAAVVLVAVMVTPVMAATSTEITGTVLKAIEVSAPAGFGMSLNPTSSPTTSPVQKATVNANHAGWTLTVVESGGDGNMSGTPGTLTNAMEIDGGDLPDYTALSGTPVTLEDGGDSVAGTTDIDDIYFQQAVEWGDAAGSYSITVTFTASPSS